MCDLLLQIGAALRPQVIIDVVMPKRKIIYVVLRDKRTKIKKAIELDRTLSAGGIRRAVIDESAALLLTGSAKRQRA